MVGAGHRSVQHVSPVTEVGFVRPPATAFLCFVFSEGKLADTCTPVLCFSAWPSVAPRPGHGQRQSVSLVAVGNRIENIRWSMAGDGTGLYIAAVARMMVFRSGGRRGTFGFVVCLVV